MRFAFCWGRFSREEDVRGGTPAGKEDVTPSMIDTNVILEAYASICCSDEGCTPVLERERLVKASWVSERKRYATSPSAVTSGTLEMMSSWRAGHGGR